MHPTRLFAAALCVALTLVSTASIAAGRYFAPAQESASGVIASDGRGGLHTAYTGYDGPTGDVVYYAHCASTCETAANWRTTALPILDPTMVQIAATADGRPRLMITSRTNGVGGAANLYNYAECNADCGEAKSWTIVVVANSADRTFSGLFQYRIAEHSFVLDGTGRPYFVYVDANYSGEPDHYGTFLTTCESACTDPENWTDGNIAVRISQNYTTELWDQVTLAAAPNGKLAMLAKVYALDDKGEQLDEGLYYYECDAGCAVRANWRRIRVIETGYGSYPNPGWDIELTADGKPRAVLFAGSDMPADTLDNILIYLWCDADCGGDNWNGHALTAKGDGEAPDLTLTADGRPRIAFLGAYGDLGYLACDDKCESDSGNWTLKLQDSTGDAAADRPTALPFTCDGELWNGFLPRVAMAGDAPWFAYDLVVEARCLYKDYGDPEITYQFHELWRGSRLSWGDGLVVPPPAGGGVRLRK